MKAERLFDGGGIKVLIQEKGADVVGVEIDMMIKRKEMSRRR